MDKTTSTDTPILFPIPDDITRIMRQIKGARIGVLGDFCVDAYWDIDSHRHEISIETGKEVLHVREQRYSPGGAGNVVLNLRALDVAKIEVFGVIGNDVFGRELTRLLCELNVVTAGLVIQTARWDTPVYGKPLLDSIEQQRLDFGAFNDLSSSTWSQLQRCLSSARDRLDFLIVNQQLPCGWCDGTRAEWVLSELRSNWAGHHLVDSRHHIKAFTSASLKLNQHEAARLLDTSDDTGNSSDDRALVMARRLAALSVEAQFLTRGERGIVFAHAGQLLEVPGISISGQTDTVGAGDTATATLAACCAAGLAPSQAAVVANLAASITVRKLNQTGTASEPELVDAARRLVYVYHPTLAEEPRRAFFEDASDIEVVEPFQPMPIKYAVFDHDGTISTLRQGWEQVMEPMMMKAILGRQYKTAGSDLFLHVQQRVKQYIEQSTGIQTIAQMDALVRIVADFNAVPQEERLDAWGYKQVYNDALMEMVNDRIRRLDRGELHQSDFIMKGAIDWLQALRSSGTQLYLVSGTDEADAVRESRLFGYASLFDGGIHGAKPGSRADTKEGIIRSILDQVAASTGGTAHSSTILVIGDGPVEIRLGRRYGALPLGVASCEERRFGLNLTKRRRLIRAGASLIVPDFSQWKQLSALLRL